MEIFSKSQGRYFPSGMVFFAILLSVVGVVVVFQKPVVGFIMVLLGPAAAFTFSGIDINLTDKTYRDYISFLGIKTGTWVPLPEIEYISVYNAKYSSSNHSYVQTYKKEDEAVAVQFVMPGNKRMFITEYDQKHKAISTAALLSNRLRIEVLDATEVESQWLGVM
jgi:hypothetical protein